MSRTGNEEGRAEADNHEGPVSHREEPGLGVERKVRVRAFGVVVGRRELAARGMEASAGGHGLSGARSRADGCTGEHLGHSISFVGGQLKISNVILTLTKVQLVLWCSCDGVEMVVKLYSCDVWRLQSSIPEWCDILY